MLPEVSYSQVEKILEERIEDLTSKKVNQVRIKLFFSFWKTVAVVL